MGLTVMALSALLSLESESLAAPRSYDAGALREDGFIDERAEGTFGNFSHTLLALAPGALIHGVGHWRMGDELGGWALFGAQLTGLAALGGVSLMRRTGDLSDPSARVGLSALSHLGWGLTLGSWVLDVIGSYQGELTFQAQPKPQVVRYASVGYRYLEDRTSTLTNHIVAGHTLKYKRWKLSTKVDLSSDELISDALSAVKLFGFTLDVSARALSASRHPVRLDLGLNGRRWRWAESDATQLALVPYLKLEWPVKGVAKGLRHTVLFQRLGYGWEGHQSPRAEAIASGADPQQLSAYDSLSSPVHHKRAVLKIETGLRIKLSPDASLTTSYLEDPTLDVTPRVWGERLAALRALGVTPNEGFWRVKLILKQGKIVKDFISEVIIGESWSSWLVLRWALGGSRG